MNHWVIIYRPTKDRYVLINPEERTAPTLNYNLGCYECSCITVIVSNFETILAYAR